MTFIIDPYRFGAPAPSFPAYQNSTSLVLVNGGSASGSLNYPSGTSTGDLLLVVATRSNTSLTSFTVPGFTQTGSDQSGTSPSFNVWYRSADGSEGASITITRGSTTSVATFWMHRFTGVDTSTPIEAALSASATGSSATPSMASVTTANPDCLAVGFVVTNAAGSQTDGSDPTGESGGSWIAKLSDKPVGGQATGLFTADMVSAGSITGGSAVLLASSNWRRSGLALRGV